MWSRIVFILCLLIYVIFSFTNHEYDSSTWQWWAVHIGYILVLLLDLCFYIKKRLKGQSGGQSVIDE